MTKPDSEKTYYDYTEKERLIWRLKDVPIGAFITFVEEKRPYRVRARSGRFIVCTRPYPKEKTVYYTIIDLVEKVRGTENLVLGLGAESDQDCWDMVDRLDGRDNNHPQGRDAVEKAAFYAKPKNRTKDRFYQPSFRTKISHRNPVNLNVVNIRIPKSCQPF